MTDLHLKFDAIDTLMFRDGRPFNQNDAGASEAVSVFPPYPPTIVGAVRAALWSSLPKWDVQKLGDGTNWQDKNNILGPLSFGAPILLKNDVPVFPMPLHVVEFEGSDKKKHLSLLEPGPKLECDLGTEQLPVCKNVGIKTIDDRWVNVAGMEKILNGRVPAENDLVKRRKLWRSEPRVGIGIDRKTRTTSDARLYMASHMRMADDVALSVSLSGWNGDFNKALHPLAGEHRAAEITTIDEVKLPEKSGKSDDNCYCIIALSPVVPDPDNDFAIAGLDNKNIVSACLGKPVVIGGWDSENKQSIPLRQCIPAGSVWFMQDDTPPDAIGLATEWGFGQVMIGKWPESKNQ